MQKFMLPAMALIAVGMLVSAFTPVVSPAPTELKWYTWEEALNLQKTAPKKIFVDVYTDWCGWCKRMDQTTFKDSSVMDYMAKNFYCVKFNAEQKDAIEFNGHKFEWVDTGNGRGVHMLAYSLLDGRLGYPAFVYLNEKFERIMISPGYKVPDDILKELHFAAEEHYTKTSLEEFKKGE